MLISVPFQIKNLTSTAQALALQKGVQVIMSYLKFVIEVSEDFERNVNDARQADNLSSYF